MQIKRTLSMFFLLWVSVTGCAPGHHSSPVPSRSPLALEQGWGIACLSVASAREQPDHKAEMAMQVLMGRAVHLLNSTSNQWWYFVQTTDGYAAWLEKGTFVRCTGQQLEEWNRSSLLIVTAPEELIRERPERDARPVADVVIADLLKNVGRQGEWFRVELPDGRTGFLPAGAAEDYVAWKGKRQPTAENLESTAREFMGRPYLWGGDSPKGFDCSGFTRLVFFLNGIELPRNAAQQAQRGTEVPLDSELTGLKKGDLVFFGAPASREKAEKVHHVGMYLGNKLFIHSSERVQINSLDPASPLRDEHRIRTLLRARRFLP